jgi:hypothetical protein
MKDRDGNEMSPRVRSKKKKSMKPSVHPGELVAELNKIYSYNVIVDVLRTFMSFPYQTLVKIARDDNVSVFERTIAKIWIKTCDEGCVNRLSFLLDRYIGKVRNFDTEGIRTLDIEGSVIPGEVKEDVYEVVMNETGKFRHPRPQLVKSI